LDLEGNKLESLPPEIGKLSALTTLKVGGNVLQSLPSELRLLRQLTLIDFENNPVTTLPESIDELLLARLAVFPASAKKKSAECCVVS
jgi:internalin A